MNEEAKRDAYLDAIAFALAMCYEREDEVKAILDANWDCPVRLERLIRALALLVVNALAGDPPREVDEALAVFRHYILEQG